MEIWSLLDWSVHGAILGSRKTFKNKFDGPITASRQKVFYFLMLFLLVQNFKTFLLEGL